MIHGEENFSQKTSAICETNKRAVEAADKHLKKISVKMYSDCNLCECSVRHDLMYIHIKHYHNIPQDITFEKLFIRIEALEKEVEDLTKENAKHSATNSLTRELSQGLSHSELKNLCQNVSKLKSSHFKTVMAMIKGGDSTDSSDLIPKCEKNNDENEDFEKVIVNMEPCIAVSLSNYVNNCQSSATVETKEDTKESENVIYDEESNKKTEGIMEEVEVVPMSPKKEITEASKVKSKIISPKKLIPGASAKKRICPYCYKQLSHKSISRHIRDMHKSKSKSNFVTCNLCEKMFRNNNSLICHMWRFHKGAKALAKVQ